MVCYINHALLIPTQSSNSKNQVVLEQKFKNFLSSTCQINLEMSVGLGIKGQEVQYSLGVRFCDWIFLFSDRSSKASDANIGIIANVVCL